MLIGHPFARRDFNPLDEDGLERCAVCGYSRGAHATDPVGSDPGIIGSYSEAMHFVLSR